MNPATDTAARRQKRPAMRRLGSVRADEVLTREEFGHRMGMEDKTLRHCERAGLRVVSFGRRKYVLGSDAIAFFEAQRKTRGANRMAGDWIPFRVDLPRSREVLAIARATGKDRHHVAGLLADFWGWASAETVDGLLPRLTVEDLCETVGGTPEFWSAVAKEDWLVIDETGLRIPKFDRWLGKGAKSRMQKAQRQAAWRAKAQTGNTFVDGQSSTGPSTIEQDSTGEDSTGDEARRDDHLDSCSWEDAARFAS